MKKKDEKIKEQKCTCEEDCNCEKDNKCTCEEDCNCKEDEIISLQEHIKKLEETLLRNQAELQNYKRRKEEEVSRMLMYSEEDIIKNFLPILDSFERAINMDDNNLEDEVSKFLEGFKMVYCQIKSLLEKYDVKEIDCVNKEFDPTYHQAVMTDKDDTKKSGMILEVMQKGYVYKDRVIRPSMVKVND